MATSEQSRKPAVGLEPTTARLQIGCSTTELYRHEQLRTLPRHGASDNVGVDKLGTRASQQCKSLSRANNRAGAGCRWRQTWQEGLTTAPALPTGSSFPTSSGSTHPTRGLGGGAAFAAADRERGSEPRDRRPPRRDRPARGVHRAFLRPRLRAFPRHRLGRSSRLSKIGRQKQNTRTLRCGRVVIEKKSSGLSAGGGAGRNRPSQQRRG